MPILKKIKKVVKKVAKTEDTPVEQPTHNEYGVCIACQAGDPNCHHNNLVQDGQHIFCNLCGFKVK